MDVIGGMFFLILLGSVAFHSDAGSCPGGGVRCLGDDEHSDNENPTSTNENLGTGISPAPGGQFPPTLPSPSTTGEGNIHRTYEFVPNSNTGIPRSPNRSVSAANSGHSSSDEESFIAFAIPPEGRRIPQASSSQIPPSRPNENPSLEYSQGSSASRSSRGTSVSSPETPVAHPSPVGLSSQGNSVSTSSRRTRVSSPESPVVPPLPDPYLGPGPWARY